MVYDKTPHPMAGGTWITLPDGAPGATATGGAPRTTGAWFRRRFSAGAGDKREILLSASTRYALFVNGAYVHNGPCKGDFWRQYYDRLDLSPYLKAGQNELLLQVVNYSTAESDALGTADGGPSAVAAKPTGPLLLVVEAGGEGKAALCTSLPGWEVQPDVSTEWIFHGATWYVGANQRIDGAKLPRDGGWQPAKATFGVQEDSPWGEFTPFTLKARPIPQLFARERKFVRQVPTRTGENGFLLAKGGEAPANSSVAAELDAGEEVTGYLRLKVSGGRGATIRVTYAECYTIDGQKGQRDDWERGELAGYHDEFLPSGHGDRFQTFWFRTFRFIRVEVRTGAEPCRIEGIDFIDTAYPLERVTEVRSAANPWVEALHHISANTLQRCMHETYEDCPYYEQLQYTQDTRLEMLFTYALAADPRMARRTIEDYQHSLLPEGILQSRYPSRKPQVIPGFALHWIFMLEDYHKQTGDVAFVRRYRATVDAVLDWFERRMDEATGLFHSLEHWPYFDWVDGWENGVPTAALEGPSTLLNLALVLGLKAGAEVMRLSSRPAVAEEYEARAAAIAEAVERLCWDEAEGLYREGPNFREFSQHGQVFAVLAGLATGERAKAMMERALADKSLKQCSFTMLYYLFRALEAAGLYDRTRELWAKWTVLLELGCTTVPEVPDAPRSECHAWGALALWDFPRYFLGVRQQGPGWQGVRIEPRCLWLNDCAGQAATPRGPVKVSWKAEGGTFQISGELPQGLIGELVLPDGSTQPIGGAFAAQCPLG